MERGNTEWKARHEEICKDFMPAGGGFDCGTKFDFVRSTDEKLVFDTSFHHMNDAGYYDGWTSHRVTVRASLGSGLRITIGGPNRNDIKDMMHEVFASALERIEAPAKIEAA
jgi:hypothetical protein